MIRTSLSVILPAYNEEENISFIIKNVEEYLKKKLRILK